ncbi:MAG: type II toxin-antitoxin system VapC family toxin [Halieaceae bacterium]|nr:type II toxin-antitoxin system VapC family toxin [Halieaceae bacterium]
MIILDTNVLSEFMTSPPSSAVADWLNAQDSMSLYITSISIAEIYYGLQVMPEGKRQRLLEDRFEQFIATAFASRLLNFDESAARIYGEIKAYRKKIGRPLSDFDGQIAAIARTYGFSLATRNLTDFEHCLIELINPFTFNTARAE